MHSYVSQATHAFLGMLPLFLLHVMIRSVKTMQMKLSMIFVQSNACTEGFNIKKNMVAVYMTTSRFKAESKPSGVQGSMNVHRGALLLVPQ